MDTRATDKAKSRLRIAKKAFSDLSSSETFGEFADNWYIFLTSTKNVYTVLEQGAKISPQSRQWFGAKKELRKNDPLLQYLFEARNDDEHGLGSSINLVPEKHEIGISGPGYSNSMVLNGGQFKNVTVSGCGTALVFEGMAPPQDLQITPLDGKPILTKRTPATAILIDVTARGNRILHPPTEHLGRQLADMSPIGVANLAINYLDSLLDEALKLA